LLPARERDRARVRKTTRSPQNPAPERMRGFFVASFTHTEPLHAPATPGQRRARARTYLRHHVARWRAVARFFHESRAETAHGRRPRRPRRGRARSRLPAGLAGRLRGRG